MKGKHRWPEELIDIGRLPRDPQFGDFYYVTAKVRECANCGLTRSEARGKPCDPEGIMARYEGRHR